MSSRAGDADAGQAVAPRPAADRADGGRTPVAEFRLAGTAAGVRVGGPSRRASPRRRLWRRLPSSPRRPGDAVPSLPCRDHRHTTASSTRVGSGRRGLRQIAPRWWPRWPRRSMSHIPVIPPVHTGAMILFVIAVAVIGVIATAAVVAAVVAAQLRRLAAMGAASGDRQLDQHRQDLRYELDRVTGLMVGLQERQAAQHGEMS